jgi:hypothetical protein
MAILNKGLLNSQLSGFLGGMKTTLEIPDTLYRQVKMRAARDGVKVKDLIAQTLSAGLHLPMQPSAAAKKAKRGSIFPLFKGPLGPLLQGKDLRSLNFLDELDDIESYQRSLRR